MSPITPDLHKTPIFKTQLPHSWMAPYEYLVRMSATKTEIAAFPTLFVAAFNGNEDAIKKVLELVFITHFAASHYAKSKDEITISNAIVYLGNQLAEHIQSQKQNAELEKLKAAIKPEAKPEAKPEPKAEPKHAKPQANPKIKFVKPGTIRRSGK